MQLIFCNTYNFDSQGANGNWAVIKFPCMVAVDEIRIVPPGVKTHSQLHEDQFTGKTSPSKFRIEFFSDDRSASMTTYEHVGSMEYAEGSPNRFHPPSALYSEKLLLNGWFSQITIAVYGGILSDVGTTPPLLDLNMKTPSLIIHEKPEGRSVYIRGVQDVPQLPKELDKPEPLMASFPATGEAEFMRRGIDDNPRGVLDDFGFQEDDMDLDAIPPPYYDRRQQRNKGFGHKNYMGERMDYNRVMGGRKTLLSGTEQDNSFRNDGDHFSYKDKNKAFHQRQHMRHEIVDNIDVGIHKQRSGNERNLQTDHGENKREQRLSEDNSETKDIGHGVDSKGEDHAKERSQWMGGEYEEISEEEIEEERAAALQDMEDLIDVEVLSSTSTMAFNPFMMEPVQLMHFNHPEMSEFEIECNNLLLQQEQEQPHQNGDEADVARFESLFTKARKIGKIQTTDSGLPVLILNAEQGKEWVAVIEEFIPLISTALPLIGVNHREKYDQYISLLVMWVLTGLDSAAASTQSIGTNLRMLKCGINLAHKLCSTTQDIVSYFTSSKLDSKLISLLCMKYMASSLKIMIVHALDAYLSWPLSIGAYINEEGIVSSEQYSALVEVMLMPQAARVAEALSRLINKITLFHSMWRLKTVVHDLITEKIPNAEDEYFFEDEYMTEDMESDVVEEVVMEEEEMVVMSSTSNDEEDDTDHFRLINKEKSTNKNLRNYENQEFTEKLSDGDAQQIHVPHTPPEDTTVPLEAAICTDEANIKVNDVENILESLRLITHTIQNIKSTIAQLPKRVFPTESNLEEIADGPALNSMFRMMEYYQILPAVQALLCTPVISSIQDVYEATYTFLDILMMRQDGLLFLASNFNCVYCIARHLLCSTPNLSTTEIESVGTASHLGAKLAIHLQCIQCVDQLGTFPEIEFDETIAEEAAEILKMLYSLTYETFGKYWVAKILSMDDHILTLLACIQKVNKEETPAKDEEDSKDVGEDKKREENLEKPRKKPQRKMAANGYAMNILLITLKMSQNVSHLLLHHEVILSTIKAATLSHSLEEVQEWLRPLNTLKSPQNAIAGCMEFLKTTFEKLEWNTLMTSGPGLCTALRILCNTSDVKHPLAFRMSSMDEKIPMSMYRTSIQIFSGGGLSVLVDGIEKLNKCFTYPCYSQHSLTTILSSSFHNLVTVLSENLLLLVNHLLKVLLSTPEGKFKPDRLTKLLVHHYAGMYTVLRQSCIEKLDIITELIVSILTLLLKTSDNNTSDDGNQKSKILTEIISSMQEHCQSMVPGMILLSHLLPLPLPIVISNELDGEAIKSVKKCRVAWDESLQSVMDELSNVVSVACHSTCLPWLEILIPLIQQISDLSPTLSQAVINVVLDTCVHASKPVVETENAEDKPVQEEEYIYNSHQISILSEIAMKGSSKATILSIIQENKRDSLNSLWKTAKQQINDRSSRLNEATMGLARVLLDPNITLVPTKLTQPSLIPQSHLQDIVSLSVDCLNSASLQTIHCALHSLKSLVSTEEWYKEIRSLLIKHHSTLNNVLETILRRWTREYMQSVATLLDFCIFVRLLCRPEKCRHSYLTKAEIRSILRWNKEFATGTHPLISLKTKLEADESDDEFVNCALDEVTVLCQTLRTSHVLKHKVQEKKNVKDKAIKPLSLQEQFEMRMIFAYGGDDDIFAARLSVLQGNTEQSFISKIIKSKSSISADLVDMAEKFCTGYSLEKSLKELTESAKTTDIDKIRMEAKAKRLKKMETFSTRHGKTMTYIKRSHGLAGPPPRGRGRGRGGMSSGRNYDLFRQRKQNTSRPPSMHVDDFVAADEEGGGTETELPPPSPPPPTFITSRRTARPFKRDYVPRGRGRGSMRGFGRGNFQHHFGSGTNIEPLSNTNDKFRNRSLTSRMPDRFPRGRGRGRDPTRSFSPRDNFKVKPQQSWSFPNGRNFGGNFSSPGGFRGGRAKALMKIGRPLLGPPPFNFNKWGGMPPRRGRGYGKPRGKHLRSFTR
ncbi:protein virilizer homolog [Styela clava]